MKHEKIKYGDVMDLGFKSDEQKDEVYEREFGFPYCIVTKNLAKKIYLDWEKDTQLCWLIRTDGNYNIMKKVPVLNLDQLKDIINFFTD